MVDAVVGQAYDWTSEHTPGGGHPFRAQIRDLTVAVVMSQNNRINLPK